jgi:hypothetical protein
MRTKIEDNKSTVKSVARTWIMTPVIAASFFASTQPTFATIDNQATAGGTYSGNPVTSPNSALIQIPVSAAAPSLSIAKSVFLAPTTAGGAEAGITDAGDTITYEYVITNNGNVTINNVVPVDTAPSFGNPQVLGTPANLGGYILISATDDLIPGQTATFRAVYTLTALDVYRAADHLVPAEAVNNSATATGTPVSGVLGPVAPGTATTTIAAGPLLSVVKSFAFTTGVSPADVGDVVTYNYVVTNNGNVPISNVVINDTHEGALLGQALFSEGALVEGPLGIPASTDAAVDGSWDLLQPGASVTFTYVHTVTQVEVDGG